MGNRQKTWDSPTLREFGRLIQARRHELNLSSREVAAKIGRSKRTLERWEVGDHNPSFLDVIELCAVLRLDLWPERPGERW